MQVRAGWVRRTDWALICQRHIHHVRCHCCSSCDEGTLQAGSAAWCARQLPSALFNKSAQIGGGGGGLTNVAHAAPAASRTEAATPQAMPAAQPPRRSLWKASRGARTAYQRGAVLPKKLAETQGLCTRGKLGSCARTGCSPSHQSTPTYQALPRKLPATQGLCARGKLGSCAHTGCSPSHQSTPTYQALPRKLAETQGLCKRGKLCTHRLLPKPPVHVCSAPKARGHRGGQRLQPRLQPHHVVVVQHADGAAHLHARSERSAQGLQGAPPTWAQPCALAEHATQ